MAGSKASPARHSSRSTLRGFTGSTTPKRDSENCASWRRRVLHAIADHRDPQCLGIEIAVVTEPARRHRLEASAPRRRFLPGHLLDAQHTIERLAGLLHLDGPL